MSVLRNSLDPDSDFSLDPDPDSMNMDPKHWFQSAEFDLTKKLTCTYGFCTYFS